MAVNSTNSSTSSAQIDVAAVVTQLMAVENKPLEAITKKIENQKLVISDLGTIKSKFSAFSDALTVFENPDSYNATSASSSDSSIVQATSSNGAQVGNYSITIDALAASSQYASSTAITSASQAVSLAVDGFKISLKSEKNVVTFDDLVAGETIKLGGLTFKATTAVSAANVALAFYGASSGRSDGDVVTTSETVTGGTISGTLSGWDISDYDEDAGTVVFTSSSTGDVDNLENGGTGSLSQVTSFDAIKTYSTADSATAIGSDPTVTDLADWINSLGVNVSASLVANDTTGSSWTLMIQSADTGIANAISSITGGGDISFSSIQTAADAEFTINSLSFTRSSNTVSDIVEGVTFDFFDTTAAATVRVKSSTTDSSSIIQNIVTTYNDLMATYKTMTANSSSQTPGNFADRPTTLSFINDIKTKFARGAYYEADYGSNFSLSWLGVDMQLDGTLKFDEANYTTAVNDGLQTILAKGVTVGYSTSETRKSTVSFSDLDAGETFVFAGLTFVAGSSGASAANVASAFADGTTGRSDGDYLGSVSSPESVTNGTIYGTLTDWDIGSYSAALGTTLFTSVRDTDALSNDGSGSATIATIANGLVSYLDGYAGTNGYIEDLINNEATIAYSLADRQDQLQTRLDSIQQNLINQYSALNSLLFQLSSTSNALTGVLNSLNNNNNN